MGVEPISIPQNLARALDAAGTRNGVDFGYLVQTAIRESSLNPEAKASSSSAVGLFQFLEGTWLQVVKQEGARLGYPDVANSIEVDSSGRYFVRDSAERQRILAMREDPQMAADMAAAFTRNNGAFLEERFGRMPSPGELYIAHFLGAGGAAKLFEAGLNNPDQPSTAIFPRQAAANPSIFYENGAPRTVRQLYQTLVAKHEQEIKADVARQSPAQAESAQATTPEPVASRFAPTNVSFTGLFRTIPEGNALPPLAPAENAGNAAFFTQLYAR
ncbi:hypothetical protein GCM10007989_36430 [Devosia pacifica]|uniref:Transglycosylase SLT domain-containing protein n=1 Tax=Devosia pacifica TaxID=1335967 RepID=A0A918SGA5_9HYPH|nr:transglycosylase SLT domain-containing protein [Devosia pacifica]GHA36996.1 hypothetical protein GCM10007989_36430 [Devosia pacifica]